MKNFLIVKKHLILFDKKKKQYIARFEKDRELSEIEILDKAYSRKTKRYVQSKLIDNTLHSNIIKKIVFDYKNEILLVLELGTKKIKYYYPD